MKPVNICTLQVRIGKCNLNLKTEGFFAISLQMNNHISSISPIKTIKNNVIAFNTTLRINIQKELLDHETTSKCRVLLHLIRENREKKVIGVATVDVLKEKDQGFKFHQFGQCADCEAEVQLSVSNSNPFELGVKSDIGCFYGERDGADLDQSREKFSIAQDSILDNSEYNILKESKAVTVARSMLEPERPVLRPTRRRNSNERKVRSRKPTNLERRTPEEIVTHYETEIQSLEEEIQSREEWATGMKRLIQELEAENQLLKEIRVEELNEYEIRNLEQGIQFMSKIVHEKFESSRSVILESPASGRQQAKNPSREHSEGELEAREEPERCLAPTKSYKGLPQMPVQSSPGLSEKPVSQQQMFGSGSPQKSQIQQNVQVLESREELQNALKILTGEEKTSTGMQQNLKIAELEEELFKIRQEKQELYDSTMELYSELKEIKRDRDSLYEEARELSIELERLGQYVDQIKSENEKLKEVNQFYEKSSSAEQFEKIRLQNQALVQKTTELQRQLKESLKAIMEFKDDALNARSEIIVKEEEVNAYKSKFGDLGSMTDVFINPANINKNYRQTQENQNTFDLAQKSNQIVVPRIQSYPPGGIERKQVELTETASTQSLHSLYSHLLQTSLAQRRELHHSLSQIISQKTPESQASESSKRQNLRRLQTQVSRLFVQILKSNPEIKNIKEIQRAKADLFKQVEEILAVA